MREKPACHPAAVEGLNARGNRPDISFLSVTPQIVARVIHILACFSSIFYFILSQSALNIFLSLSGP